MDELTKRRLMAWLETAPWWDELPYVKHKCHDCGATWSDTWHWDADCMAWFCDDCWYEEE